MLKAPWTQDQVNSLNDYQAAGVFHPFTCGNENCRADLTATIDGWYCETCRKNGKEYHQDWCHSWMADRSWAKS